ncbi:UNVERIFIED_CONTAM: hypothetical protein FKN15_020265 [Acipenser sinensis]
MLTAALLASLAKAMLSVEMLPAARLAPPAKAILAAAMLAPPAEMLLAARLAVEKLTALCHPPGVAVALPVAMLPLARDTLVVAEALGTPDVALTLAAAMLPSVRDTTVVMVALAAVMMPSVRDTPATAAVCRTPSTTRGILSTASISPGYPLLIFFSWTSGFSLIKSKRISRMPAVAQPM